MLAPTRIYLWPDRFLYLGSSFDTGCHQHHAAQVLAGLDGPFLVRGSVEDSWLSMQAALIDTNTPHLADASSTDMAALYIEPESAIYAALRQTLRPENRTGRFEIIALQVDQELIHKLAAYRLRGTDCRTARQASLALLGLETEPHGNNLALDPRVSAAQEYLRVGYDGLDDLASQLHISPSRLAHLFREQVGVAIRRYAVWARLRRAVEYALGGASLTETAHAVGFADSAHLSNSFRQMFGLPPSFLFDRRISLDAHLCSNCGPTNSPANDQGQLSSRT